MSLIDNRGRLFGKVNLIDAIVGAVTLMLIPLAYGAFLLFRTPIPKITSIQPAQVIEHQTVTLHVTGDDLRPFLGARLGSVESAGFLVQSPTVAEIKLPDLPVGTYDVTLYDQGQELLRKPAAVTVVAAAPPSALPPMRLELQAVGAFVGLSKDDAALIGPTSKFAASHGQTATPTPPIAEVLAVRAPEPATYRLKITANLFATALMPDLRVPAIIRLYCAVVNSECKIGDTVAANNTTITLPLGMPASTDHSVPVGSPHVKFFIDQIFPAGARPEFPTVAAIRVRFVAQPQILNVLKAGDVDVSGVITDTDRAVLTEVGSDRQTMPAVITTESFLRHSFQLQQPVLTFIGTVRVPVVFTPSGWSYQDRPMKVGGMFTFETTSGALIGWILDMTFDSKPARKPQ